MTSGQSQTTASGDAPRAVLFDATGTLIELREPVGERYARTAQRHGVALPAWRLDDAFRRVVARAGPRVFPEAAGSGEPVVRELERKWWWRIVRDTFRAADQTLRFEDFDAFFDDLFRSYAGADAWRLREGVRDALATLEARGVAMGVVSDFDYRLTEILESLGIAGFFGTVVLCGPHGCTKPDPRLFRAALTALGASAGTAVYVGDDPVRDRTGAEAAGICFLDVAELGSFEELTARLATLPHRPGTADRAGPHTENR